MYINLKSQLLIAYSKETFGTNKLEVGHQSIFYLYFYSVFEIKLEMPICENVKVILLLPTLL